MSDRTPQEAEAIERGAEAFYVMDTGYEWKDAVEGVRQWYRNAAWAMLDALLAPSPCDNCATESGAAFREAGWTCPIPDCTDGTVPPLLRWNDQ